MNENFVELYNYFSSNNLTDLSQNDFYSAYSDPSKASEIYSYLSSKNMTDLDEQSFYSSYFGSGKKKEPTDSVGEPEKPITTSATADQKKETQRSAGSNLLTQLGKAAGGKKETIRGLVFDQEDKKREVSVGSIKKDIKRAAGVNDVGEGEMIIENYQPAMPELKTYSGLPGKEEETYRKNDQGDWQVEKSNPNSPVSYWDTVKDTNKVSELEKYFIGTDVDSEEFKSKNLDKFERQRILDEIDTDIMLKNEGEAVTALEKIFESSPKYKGLFTFEEYGPGYDAIKITNNKTGKSQAVALHSWMSPDRTQKELRVLKSNLEMAMYSIQKDEKLKRIKEIEEELPYSELVTPSLQNIDKVKELNKLKEEAGELDAVARNYAGKSDDLLAATHGKYDMNNIKTEREIHRLEKKKLAEAVKESAEWYDQAQEMRNTGEISYEEYESEYAPKIAETRAKHEQSAQQLAEQEKALIAKNKDIEKAVVAYLSSEEDRGTLLGGVGMSAARGAAAPLSFILRAAGYNTGKDEAGDTFIDRFAEDFSPGIVTKEYLTSADRNMFEKAVFGITESVAASMVGSALMPYTGAGSILGLYAQSYENFRNELDTPEFNDVPAYDKILLSAAYGSVVGVLEKFGLSSVFAKTPAGKGAIGWIMKRTFKNIPKNAPAELVEMEINKSVKAAIANKLLRVTAAGNIEGGTEATQELASILLKEGYNIAKGKDYFESPKSFYDGFKQVGENYLVGIVGGGVMNGASQSFSVINNGGFTDNNFDPAAYEILKRMSTDQNLRDMFITHMNGRIAAGEVTKQEATEIVAEMDKSASIFRKIPSDLNYENKPKAFDLINERQRLEKEMEGMDKALVANKAARVAEINSELESLTKTEEDAVQEQATGEVPVQPEAKVGEEVEEGAPTPESEVTTEEGAKAEITPENSSNYANLTEDNEGNFVFFHVGDKGYNKIKKSSGKTLATSREEASALSKVGGMAMYYTRISDSEGMVKGQGKYAVKIPKEKVYDFNNDPLNFIEEARARFESEYPGQAFTPNTQVAYVTKIAGENGYDMVVSEWDGRTRAQTTQEFKPTDVQERSGDRVTKDFSEKYESNSEKGFESVIPESKESKLKSVYDKIYNERNKQGKYDDLYRLTEESAKKSQEEITNLIENSDLSEELKQEYRDALKYKPEQRRSIKNGTETSEAEQLSQPPAGSRLFSEPVKEVSDIAKKYKEDKNIDTPEGKAFSDLNEERSKEIADAYENMKHEPENPDVMSAYEAMATETIDQYQAISDSGYVFEIWEGEGEPYANSSEMLKDVRENKHMYILSTENDFGDTPITEQQRKENPLLRDSGIKDVNGKTLLVNDIFRGVHDFFGHAERGNSFGPKGEENAWDVHVRMYSPLAARAMTTETRGQNSWVNFSGVNDGAKAKFKEATKLRKEGKTEEADKLRDEARSEFIFAEQKIGLLPEKYSQIESEYNKKSEFESAFTKGSGQAIDVINKYIDKLDDFGKGTLGVNIPVVVAKNALIAARTAAKTAKTLSEIVDAVVDSVQKSAWYNNLKTKEEKDKALKNAKVLLTNLEKVVEKDKSQEYIDAISKAKEKFELSKKRENTEKQAIESAIEDLRKNESISENEKNSAIIELRKYFGLKEKKSPSAARITGKPKPKKVTVDERVALREQIRLEAKAARDAAKSEKEARRNLAEFLKERIGKIKGIVKGDKLTTVINRALKMNLSNPEMADRFADYVIKLSKDAEYGEKLSSSNKLRSKIRKKLKQKDIQSNNKSLAKKFLSLDPKYSESIDEYLENAEKVLSSLEKTGTRRGALSIKQQANVDQVLEFIDKSIEYQNKVKMDMIELSFPELFESGAITSDMSPAEAMYIVENIDLEKTDKKISEKKLQEMRDRLSASIDAMATYLSDMIKSEQDPMTGEDIVLTAEEIQNLKSLLKIDQNNLTLEEMFTFTDLLQNAAINQEISSVATFVEKINGRIEANKMYKENGRLDSKGSVVSSVVNPASGVTLITSQILGGINRAKEFLLKSGFNAIRDGKAQAIKIAREAVDQYDSMFAKKKANGEGFDSKFNRIERRMYSFLIRSVNGSKLQDAKEFTRRLKLIREQVQLFESEFADENMRRKAAKLREVADKLGIFEDGVTRDDIIARVDKVNADAVSFWIEKFAQYYPEMAEVSMSVYNRELSADINYIPDAYKRVITVLATDVDKMAENASRNGAFGKYDTESTSLTVANRPNALPSEKFGEVRKTTMYIDMDFDSVVSNAFSEAMTDIKTAKPIRRFQGFINSASFQKMVGNDRNRKMMVDAMERYIRNTKGITASSREQNILGRSIDKIVSTISTLGGSVLLGGADQIIKQSVSMIANTGINSVYVGINNGNFSASIGGLYLSAGKNAGFKFSMVPPLALVASKKYNQWLIDGMVDIAAFRGIESMGTIDQAKFKSQADSVLEKGLDNIKALPEAYVNLFLVNGDKMVAKSAFLMYYKKHLVKNGKSPIVDFSKPMDPKAKSYAMAQVSKQQGESDADMSSVLYSKDTNKSFRNAVKLLMPLSSFILNKKASITSDLSILLRKNADKQDRLSAVQSMSSSIAEVAIYSAVSIMLREMIISQIATAITGYDEEELDPDVNKAVKKENKLREANDMEPMTDEEETAFRRIKLAEKKARQNEGMFITNLFKDLSPLPPFLEYYQLTAIDEGRKLMQEYTKSDEIEKAIKDQEKIDGKKMTDIKRKEFIANYIEKETTRLMIFDNDNNFGSFGFLGDQMSEDFELVKAERTGEIKTYSGTTKYLTKEQKEIARNLNYLLATSKVAPKDVRKVVMKSFRQLKKMALTANQLENYNAMKEMSGDKYTPQELVEMIKKGEKLSDKKKETYNQIIKEYDKKDIPDDIFEMIMNGKEVSDIRVEIYRRTGVTAKR